LANRRAHFETTGPEIYAQTDGEVDGFVCAAGTGGTLAGIAQYLKQMKGDNVKVFVGDPTGSALHSYFTSGKTSLESSDVATVAEGIGQKFVTDNVAASEDLIDGAFSISDEESIKMVYRLLDEEGIYVGLSSALNVVAATKLAKELGKGNYLQSMNTRSTTAS
jgi:cysteine synthase A